MDISKQFSLTDFLAYFFPGLFATAGIYLALLLTPFQTYLLTSFSNVTVGLIFLALSYVVGILFSGISLNIVEWVERVQKHKNSRGIITVDKFQDDIVKAFKDVFNVSKDSNKPQWSNAHFYLCRALVLEKMPTVGQRIERQSSIRQLRGNLVFPILIWMVIGIGWGIYLLQIKINEWGIALIASSFIIGVLFLRITFSRMHNNEDREVREVLTGFLAGYSAGIFQKKIPNKVNH
jgi:uncharacterized membrane protein